MNHALSCWKRKEISEQNEVMCVVGAVLQNFYNLENNKPMGAKSLTQIGGHQSAVVFF